MKKLTKEAVWKLPYGDRIREFIELSRLKEVVEDLKAKRKRLDSWGGDDPGASMEDDADGDYISWADIEEAFSSTWKK